MLGVNGPASGATRNIAVGLNGTSANLTIRNGSTLTSAGTLFVIGSTGGSAGTVTVTGAGSNWLLSGATLSVGNSGTGTLNIENGAQVTANNGVSVGRLTNGSGTLNISGGGTLVTQFLRGRPRREPSQLRQRHPESDCQQRDLHQRISRPQPEHPGGRADDRHGRVHRGYRCNVHIHGRRWIDQDRRRHSEPGRQQCVYRPDRDPGRHPRADWCGRHQQFEPRRCERNI
ncbi:hypothetical protein [Bradyrhizobium yuanmingense]|uniref:hypothetical protein n=1 Tax=Bradyrhizobium yuanmingense TaxID=108015 RepID=UPI003511DA2A